ncbi:hypothetical protein EMIT0215P_260035 [Pseudomonas serboccidentalis]
MARGSSGDLSFEFLVLVRDYQLSWLAPDQGFLYNAVIVIWCLVYRILLI